MIQFLLHWLLVLVLRVPPGTRDERGSSPTHTVTSTCHGSRRLQLRSVWGQLPMDAGALCSRDSFSLSDSEAHILLWNSFEITHTKSNREQVEDKS